MPGAATVRRRIMPEAWRMSKSAPSRDTLPRDVPREAAYVVSSIMGRRNRGAIRASRCSDALPYVSASSRPSNLA